MVLLAMIFVSLSVAGCGTLRNGRGWGQDAIYSVDLKRIPRAAFNALVDPETLIPMAGAIVFSINGYDKKVSIPIVIFVIFLGTFISVLFFLTLF